MDTYSSHREVEKPKTRKGRRALLCTEVEALVPRMETAESAIRAALGDHTTQHLPIVYLARQSMDLLKRLRAELK